LKRAITLVPGNCFAKVFSLLENIIQENFSRKYSR